MADGRSSFTRGVDVLAAVVEAAANQHRRRLGSLIDPLALGFDGEVCVARTSQQLIDYLLLARPFERAVWRFEAAAELDGDVILPSADLGRGTVTMMAFVDGGGLAELHFAARKSRVPRDPPR